MIWKREFTLEMLNFSAKNTLVETLGIKYVEIGDDFIKATMPVDERTIQPMGLLHGGASAALAETLGSVASTFSLEDMRLNGIVGIELNATHLRPAKSGIVTGTVRPIKLGRKLHVWEIVVENEEGKKCCISRLTTMIINQS